MINAEWLRAFVAFAEESSFTAAAARLHISQPALHVQVRKLSEQVGVPLYERHGRGVKLTLQGQELLAFGRDQQERTEHVLQTLRGEDPSLPTVLAAGEGAYLYLLGDALRRYNARFPERLTCLTCDREETLAAVASGRAHLGVTTLDEAPQPDLVAEPLRRVGAVVVVPRNHRLAKRRRLRVRDLEGERWVLPPRGKAQRQMLAKRFAEEGIELQPSVEASGWELILQFARLGFGLAIVNDFCRVPQGMVAKALPELPAVEYFLVRSRRALVRSSVEALGEAIRRTC